MRKIIPLLIILLAFSGVSYASTADDDQIRQKIIEDSISSYLSTGHPCACPYNLARNGSHCGGRSAYSRPGGAAPLCYPADVTDQMVSDWKRQHS